MIQIFNNKTDKAGDDLKKSINRESKLQVAAGLFSIYGFESLKNELKKIEKLSFIFTDPTFIELDKNKREQKELVDCFAN
ncbi:MAG: helicase [Proteobacteria bacterium]|nr:helicase [Pseudomonadota bacterium]